MTAPEPSPTRVVGIGASAGGIDALMRGLGPAPDISIRPLAGTPT